MAISSISQLGILGSTPRVFRAAATDFRCLANVAVLLALDILLIRHCLSYRSAGHISLCRTGLSSMILFASPSFMNAITIGDVALRSGCLGIQPMYFDLCSSSKALFSCSMASLTPSKFSMPYIGAYCCSVFKTRYPVDGELTQGLRSTVGGCPNAEISTLGLIG